MSRWPIKLRCSCGATAKGTFDYELVGGQLLGYNYRSDCGEFSCPRCDYRLWCENMKEADIWHQTLKKIPKPQQKLKKDDR